MDMSTGGVRVARQADARPIGRLAVTVIGLCALVNMLDGMDTQSIGVAAPLMAQEMGVKIAEFGPIFSAALLGATVGAIGFGVLADRFGRKRLLIAALVIMGVFTTFTAHAPTLGSLVVYRFLAGIGLGGATPCFIALTSEYAPQEHRSACVTLMWSGFPLGAMLGAFANSMMLPHFGWRAIFYLGGILPLVLALILLVFLPESLRFLLAQGRIEQARTIMRRLNGVEPELLALSPLEKQRNGGLPLLEVFKEGRGLLTLVLWVPFLTSMGILTVSVLWTPALMRLNSVAPEATAFVVAFNGLGAFIGQAAAGRLIERFAPVPVLVPAFMLGAAATVGLGYGASSVAAAACFNGLVGLFLGLASAGAIALAAQTYPVAIRSSGVGLAMAMGRFGQMVSPLLAGAMLGAGFDAPAIMLVIGTGAVIGAVFVGLFHLLASRHQLSAAASHAT